MKDKHFYYIAGAFVLGLLVGGGYVTLQWNAKIKEQDSKTKPTTAS